MSSRGKHSIRDKRYVEEIEEKVRSIDLDDRVILIKEFVDQPEELMILADVFAMPTLRDVFGTPVHEAIACGTPAICHDLPGVFDQYLMDGVNGYRVPMVVEDWCRAVVSANHIEDEVKREASQAVLREAGVQVIDEAYVADLSSLVGR